MRLKEVTVGIGVVKGVGAQAGCKAQHWLLLAKGKEKEREKGKEEVEEKGKEKEKAEGAEESKPGCWCRIGQLRWLLHPFGAQTAGVGSLFHLGLWSSGG